MSTRVAARTGGRGIKEEAARLVLRDAWQRGHSCIELRYDGQKPIFFCKICETRCYSDGALWDHLRGNVHARNKATSALILAGSSPYLSSQHCQLIPYRGLGSGEGSAAVVVPRLTISLSGGSSIAGSEVTLEWVGNGRLFLKTSKTTKKIDACWMQWVGKRFEEKGKYEVKDAGTVRNYGIVILPYAEGLGKGGIPGFGVPSPEDHGAGCDVIMDEKKAMRGSLKEGGRQRRRRRKKVVERVCNICRQKMEPGKDVATLLNCTNLQMVCHSRNWRGAFHVFHSNCLIAWILFFESKEWMGQPLTFVNSNRRSPRTALETMGYALNIQQQVKGGNLNKVNDPIFCPECQGTGVRVNGQLEQPRYRLAQIFDWTLELVQARKAWIDSHVQQVQGLIGLCFPYGETVQAMVPLPSVNNGLLRPRGLVQCYSMGEKSTLGRNAIGCKVTGMEVDEMDIDV